jgi:hypothetical protein
MPAGDLVNPLGQRVQIPRCPLTVTAPGQQPHTRGEPVTVPLYPRSGGRPLQRWTREDCRTSRAWHNSVSRG